MSNHLQLVRMAELMLPISLDGSTGLNRISNKTPHIKAMTDIEAINCWLAEYQKSEETFRNYQKEAERLLLWSIIQQQKPLSSLDSDDLLAYSQFLDNPKPTEFWCGAKHGSKGKRYTQGWKPFVGGLSAATKVTTLRIINSLFDYLVAMQYLTYNPMLVVRRQLKYQQKQTMDEQKLKLQERIIDFEQWDAILNTIEKLPENTEDQEYEKARLFFIIVSFYKAGLRAKELRKHTMANFRQEFDHEYQKHRWWLYVIGKGDKLRKIPVDDEWLSALVRYRKIRTLPDSPLPTEENEPLIASPKTKKSITDRRINQLIKDIVFEAAKTFDATQPEKAEQLRKVSAHWFRHFSCTVQNILKIDRTHTQKNMGHSKIETLNLYDHSLDNLRHEQTQRLKLRPDILKQP